MTQRAIVTAEGVEGERSERVMPRKCTVCTNKKRSEIDRALIEHAPYRHIAARFGVSTSALVRHHDDHIQAKLLRAREAHAAADALTPKQHAFLLGYLVTGNGSAAYRRSYNVSKMSQAAIAVEACRLLKNPNIALMVTEARREAQERCQVTIESATIELEEDRRAALANGQAAAAVTATMSKAKLHGLLEPEKSGPPTDQNLTTILSQIDEEELLRRYTETILLRQQRRQRLGHDGNG